VTGWPDADTRDRKAIDALASDSGGHVLAIEHTLLQPFTGDKADQIPFLKTIGRLDRRQDLAEPNSMIDLIIQVGAIRKGVDWTELANGLEAWFLAIRGLPAGRSVYDVTGLPCPVRVTVGKSSLPDTPGLLFVLRHMPAESIEPVLRTALAAKLPKLAATTASERILLLELDSPARGNWEIGQAIDDVRSDFPDIGLISTIWLAKTMVWESEGYAGRRHNDGQNTAAEEAHTLESRRDSTRRIRRSAAAFEIDREVVWQLTPANRVRHRFDVIGQADE